MHKEIDTRNMDSVVTVLIMEIDAAGSQVQQTAHQQQRQQQQFQTTFEAEQSLESGTRHCRQVAGKVQRDFQRDEEHVVQDLLEEGFH